MRGEPIDISPPVSGFVANVPPHLAPRDSLIGGQNTVLDIDGLTKPRFGYQPQTTPPPGIGPIIGVWWYTDTDGKQQYLAVSPTRIVTFQNDAWVDVTGPTPLHGDIDDPVVFQNYFQNGVINVIICNNNDPLLVWNSLQTTVLPLTPTYALTGTNSYTGTTGLSLTAYPVNTQFFFTVQNANTGAVTIALDGLGAITAQHFVNGALAPFTGGELQPSVVYNFSYNGTVFVLGTNLQAPIAKDISVVAGRVVAINILTGLTRNVMQVTWTAAFDMTVWPALAFNNLVDLDDPLQNIQPIGDLAATIFGTQSGWLCQSVAGVTDPFAFNFSVIRGVTTGPASVCSIVVAEGLQYIFGIDGRIWATDCSSYWTVSQAIDPAVLMDFNVSSASQVNGFYYAQYRQIWWFWPSKSSNLNGPSKATVYDLRRQAFEPVQVFPEVIRSSYQEAAATGITWKMLTQPWNTYHVTWNSFTSVDQLSAFLGTDAGDVHVFSVASTTDNGVGIPYSLSPALLFANSKSDILIDSFDIFFKPASSFELLTLQAQLLQFPYDSGQTAFASAFDLSDGKTYAVPTSLPSLNTYGRYIALTFFGISYKRAMAYAGGTVFVTKQDRPSQEYR